MTSENQIPSTPEISQSNDESDSIDAFVERVKQLYSSERTSLDDLLELSRNPDAKSQFEDLLDDLAYEALTQNEEFMANREVLHSKSHDGPEILKVRNRQRELFAQYKEAIVLEAGVPTERSKSEIDAAKKRVQELVQAEVTRNPSAEPSDILKVLGMISLDKQGNEIFVYPENLFPPSTDDKWATYLETVNSWVRLKSAVDDGLRDFHELEDIDGTRRVAHNAVARDLDEILGLGKLPDSEWDFVKTRNLLAKMRDARFPTVETGEKSVTEKAVLKGVIGQHAIKALRTRASDLHGHE